MPNNLGEYICTDGSKKNDNYTIKNGDYLYLYRDVNDIYVVLNHSSTEKTQLKALVECQNYDDQTNWKYPEITTTVRSIFFGTFLNGEIAQNDTNINATYNSTVGFLYLNTSRSINNITQYLPLNQVVLIYADVIYAQNTNNVLSFRWIFNVMCIHPDMIVDDLSIAIQNINVENENVMTAYPSLTDNLRLGYTDTFVRIKKDALGTNVPSTDLLLTGKHPIMYNNEEVKVETLVNGSNIIYEILPEPVEVYCLAFDTRRTIKMHGVDVWQWDINTFRNIGSVTGLVYRNHIFRTIADAQQK